MRDPGNEVEPDLLPRNHSLEFKIELDKIKEKNVFFNNNVKEQLSMQDRSVIVIGITHVYLKL